MQTMFYTLPLLTSAFTSWLTGAFDLFWLCNFNKSVRLQIVLVSPKKKENGKKNRQKALLDKNFFKKLEIIPLIFL